MDFRAPRMNERESDAWLSLVTVMQLLPAALDSQLERDAGMTHFEFQVLSLLRMEPGNTVRVKEIADRTAATLPRVSKVLTRLERRGLLERTTAAEDRRASNVTLTAQGRREVIRATAGHVSFVRRTVVDQFDEESLAQLAAISQTITQALQADKSS
jgi:DNA-binding MarR family transcriptional regulator